MIVERVGRPRRPVRHPLESGSAGVPVGHAIGRARGIDIEIARRAGGIEHPAVDRLPPAEMRQLAVRDGREKLDLFGEAEHPSEGRYRTVRSPVSFSTAPFRIRRHAPRLGEHTAEVLREAGLTQSEIDAAMN